MSSVSGRTVKLPLFGAASLGALDAAVGVVGCVDPGAEEGVDATACDAGPAVGAPFELGCTGDPSTCPVLGCVRAVPACVLGALCPPPAFGVSAAFGSALGVDGAFSAVRAPLVPTPTTSPSGPLGGSAAGARFLGLRFLCGASSPRTRHVRRRLAVIGRPPFVR